MAEVLENLRNRQSQEGAPAVSEEKVNCSKCHDKGVVIYRVHEDTKWDEIQHIEGDRVITIHKPQKMVPEDDFFGGKVCGPDKAREWRTTYSIICQCTVERKKSRLLKSSEITEEFKKLGFGNFRTEGKASVIAEAKEAALEYYKDFEEIRGTRFNSIALIGQPGAGKTHLLTAIANNLIMKKLVNVQYFPYVEGFNDLKDDFDKLEAKMKHLKDVEVLFIDDLFKPARGKPRATEWQVEQLYAVINYRYLNHKPIMISSELDVDQIIDIDEALGTRIYEMCSNYTVVIKGDRKTLNHRLEGL
ncbi:DnaA ATPase domain-containing protein [Jeotgalibacillus alimentarius]|uniref:DnaA ATPase domain-containing protein n=1 Tax=Jeotgalibacillus alimentarius TaxID=135826 RepID=UPI0006971FC4|nr:DnaA/Hda family protein [Jeotgalibacillus alimentarius]